MDWIFAVALLALGLVAWSYWTRRRRSHHIATYPYRNLLDKRLAARHPQLSEAQRALVYRALQDYFQVCHAARRRLVAMPSQVVDDAWHEFILFTRHYQEYCGRAFGHFLHHTPAEAMRAPTDAQDGIKRAWRLACRCEGIDPRNPRRMPLLFAIDAMLAVPNGFDYVLDCMAGRGSGPGGYCASHIGCGGGCSGGGSGDSGGGSGCGGDGGGCGGGD